MSLIPMERASDTDEFDLLVLAGHSLDSSTLRKAAALRLKGILVWNLPRLFSEFAERLPAQYLDERWVATAEGFRSLNETSFQVIKRLVDIVLAFVGLVLSSPLLAWRRSSSSFRTEGRYSTPRKEWVKEGRPSAFTSCAPWWEKRRRSPARFGPRAATRA